MKHVFALLAFALMSSGLAQIPEYVPPVGLVGWYPLNGSAEDLSGFSNHGTVHGATPTVDRTGSYAGAMNFNVDDWSWGSGGNWIYIPFMDLFNTSAVSISVWVKRNSGGLSWNAQPQAIAHRYQYGYSNPNGESWTFGIDNSQGPSSNRIYSGIIQQASSPAPYLSAISMDETIEGEWFHVSMTWTGSNLRIYENGVVVAEVTEDFEMNTIGNSGISLGMSVQANGHWGPLDGDLDDFGVWNRALDEGEVLSLYQSSVSIEGCTDLTACNWNPQANINDGSCEYLSCVGCLNSLACNYDSDATQPGSCNFPNEGCEECVDGIVTAIDIDNDGVADCDELDGCADPAACNFMPAATEDDGSCVMQPQEIWQGEQLFSLEEELDLAVSGVDYVIWSDNTTENPLTVVESGTYGFTMVNGDLNEMSQSVAAGPGSCGVVEAGSDWKADQFTVGLWLKLDNANRGYILMEGDDGWLDDFGLALQCIDGFIELDVNHLNLGLTSVNLNDGNWHAVHVMYNGSAIQLYIDGALNTDVPFEDTIDQNDWPIVLGSKKSYECTTDDGSGSVFEGSLSRLSIWSRTLEPWELMESITCGERFVGESLVGHWPLDGSGASDELVALAGEAGVNHDMAVVEDSPVGSCSRCATSDWVEVVLATDLCGEGTVWDASAMTCVVANPSDTDFDGCVSMTDLLDLLTVFGTCAEAESEPEVGEWSCADPLEYQGYDYETVQIGEQCWFAENLRAEFYLNGEAIPTDLSDTLWSSASQGAFAKNPTPDYAWQGASAYDIGGPLYNWFAVDEVRGICPSGWHVPNDIEWEELAMSLGGSSEAGQKMKAVEGWNPDCYFANADPCQLEGTNESGFNGVPAGYRNYLGEFISLGLGALWWSATADPQPNFRNIEFDSNELGSNSFDAHSGHSVRCIQDSE